ncbi:MAG: type II toxin-antitoxin system HicA family toxin [Firmicutes bacterium]|nr:type II toxin-antitoxin system HicA family toxin [Bacillota bacterium]
MTVREIEKLLKKAGWYEVRTNGGHKNFRHQEYSDVVTVPQHKGDLKKGTANDILKKARVEK